MKMTLRECFEEMYREALRDVKKKFETEALTERELYYALRKYVEEFEGDYTSYEFFCEESPIYDEFFELVKKLPEVEVKDFELYAFPEGFKVPVEVRLYGYPKHFNTKIERLQKGDPYQLLRHQSIRY